MSVQVNGFPAVGSKVIFRFVDPATGNKVIVKAPPLENNPMVDSLRNADLHKAVFGGVPDHWVTCAKESAQILAEEARQSGREIRKEFVPLSNLQELDALIKSGAWRKVPLRDSGVLSTRMEALYQPTDPIFSGIQEVRITARITAYWSEFDLPLARKMAEEEKEPVSCEYLQHYGDTEGKLDLSKSPCNLKNEMAETIGNTYPMDSRETVEKSQILFSQSPSGSSTR